nr:hypothetical protein OH820_13570 [Streptomyces sp. NBC_00857]
MPSRTSVSEPHAPAPVGPELTQGALVLDRVAARVRQRLAAEHAAADRVGEGGHQASLIWSRPL